jgi:hypothetical protein
MRYERISCSRNKRLKQDGISRALHYARGGRLFLILLGVIRMIASFPTRWFGVGRRNAIRAVAIAIGVQQRTQAALVTSALGLGCVKTRRRANCGEKHSF